MKNIIKIILLFICIIDSVISQNKMNIFYVSLAGNDSWSGKIPDPDLSKKDGPFLTLERVKIVIRELRKDTPLDTIIIYIRVGIYPIEKTFKLDLMDLKLNDAPIILSAYQNEEVHFIGSKIIKGFKKISDSAILKRIDKEYQDKILVADLKSQWITDYGIFPNRIELFFKGERMVVARYPNKGWLFIADVPQSGEKLIFNGDIKIVRSGYPAGRHYGKFTYTGDRPDRWREDNNIWMHGYWSWDWKDAYQKVEKIDKRNHIIYPTEPHHPYGYQKGQRFYFLNVLEELDKEGEWYLDVLSGLLYFWPPSDIKENDVSVSQLNENMIYLENASNIVISKIIFEGSRVGAIRIKNGSNNLIAGCTIRNIGNDTSVIIDGGKNNGIKSCDIYDVGGTGVRIIGGDRKTLTPAGNYAINNHLYKFGRVSRAFNGGIWLEGVGNILSHNRIHDGAFSGIQYYGNDHIMEFNDIYDLAHEAGDVGGVNTGADYAHQGNQIRYNYFHHSHGYGEGGFRAAYLDLPGSGTTIYGNIFYKVDIGVFFNSGRDNLIKNNVFVKCSTSVNIYAWPHKTYFDVGGPWKIIEKLMEIKFREPPYSIKYPKLLDYLNPKELGLPYGNVVVNNISYGGKWLDLSETFDFNDVIVEKNYIADSMLVVFTKKWIPDFDPYHLGYSATYKFGDELMTKELKKYGNIVSDKDPGFIDLKNANFQIKDNSPVFKLGFKKIPIEKIGLYIDEYRKKLPTADKFD